jgi:hypothetical protein
VEINCWSSKVRIILESSLLFVLYTDSFSSIGRGFKTKIESPKNEKIALFELGERAYDHVLLLPAKSKGMARCAMNTRIESDLTRSWTKSHT